MPDPDDPGLMCLWDSLRSEAIRFVAIASFLVLFIGYFGAASILAGVALLDPRPAEVQNSAAVVLVIGVVFGAIGEEGARHMRWWFRKRLWPQYDEDALFAFGDARFAAPPGL